MRTAFRVGALATLSRNFQLSFLKPILGRQDVEIVLRSGSFNELMAALEAHQLDVVLTNQLLRQDSLTPVVAHRLADQNVSLVGVPGLAQDGADLPELLRNHPIVLPSVQSSVRIDFDALASRLGVHPLIAAEVDDMAMMRLLVREGAGLGVIPRSSCGTSSPRARSGARPVAGDPRAVLRGHCQAEVSQSAAGALLDAGTP